MLEIRMIESNTATIVADVKIYVPITAEIVSKARAVARSNTIRTPIFTLKAHGTLLRFP